MFMSTLLTYIVIFLISLVLAFAAVMIGKKLRDNKNAKTPVKTLDLEEENK